MSVKSWNLSTYLILAADNPSLTNSLFSMLSTTKGWLFPSILLFFLPHFLYFSVHFYTSGVPRHNKSHWLLVCKAYTKPWRRFDKNTKILWKIMLWQMKSLKRAWPACFSTFRSRSSCFLRLLKTIHLSLWHQVLMDCWGTSTSWLWGAGHAGLWIQ